MMQDLMFNKNHLINKSQTIKYALNQLNGLGEYLTLFVIDDDSRLVGTLTDGDIRRALIRDLDVNECIESVMFGKFVALQQGKFSFQDISEIRANKIGMVPIVDDNFCIKKIINLDLLKSFLPVDAVIMAGGEGIRLKPLTDSTPKPLLKVGDKPIIEHNLDRLANFGVGNIFITLKYLGNQISTYFGDGADRFLNISYITEEQPLGTIGALSLIDRFDHDYILLMNSDILTNIDFEDFFIEFTNSDAEMAVATIPYKVNIPYAVLETNCNLITSFMEKPTYTYYSNAGIYLLKRSIIDVIPRNQFYNATDLMEVLIQQGKKVLSYPLLSYWLDIGKHEDYIKAQVDIKHIKF